MRPFVIASLALGLNFFLLSQVDAQHGRSGNHGNNNSHGNNNGHGNDNSHGHDNGHGAQSVPELDANAMPAALALLAGGAVLLTSRRRRFV